MKNKMKIVTVSSDDHALIQQAAQLMVDAFREHWPDAWPTLEDGLKEVHEMLERIIHVVLHQAFVMQKLDRREIVHIFGIDQRPVAIENEEIEFFHSVILSKAKDLLWHEILRLLRALRMTGIV